MTSIELYGFTLDLPNGHWLTPVLQELPDYRRNLGRLAVSVERKYPGRGFIDVGANVGDTAAIVRAHSGLPILCIEGSEFYYELLKENIHQLQADVELECALVDCATVERNGCLTVQHGTAMFRTDSNGNARRHFERLDQILARHPRFQSSKILKVDTDGMEGRILQGALEWIAAARPVLYWGHDIRRDVEAEGPGLRIFECLVDAGYRTALLFDNTGEFIQTISLDARQQLADLADYLPGGKQFSAYCDICAFHDEDLDLCARIRRLELENRRPAGKTGSQPLDEARVRALVQAEFETHGSQITNAVQQTLKSYLVGEGPLSTELRALRAQSQFDRYRQQLQITDLESRVASKDAEIERLQTILRELLVEIRVERSVRNQNEEIQRQTEFDELNRRLAGALDEGVILRHQIDTSLALRTAKAFGWILRPVRRLIGGSSNGDGR